MSPQNISVDSILRILCKWCILIILNQFYPWLCGLTCDIAARQAFTLYGSGMFHFLNLPGYKQWIKIWETKITLHKEIIFVLHNWFQSKNFLTLQPFTLLFPLFYGRSLSLCYNLKCHPKVYGFQGFLSCVLLKIEMLPC